MADAEVVAAKPKPKWRKWLHRAFLTWAVVSTAWFANSIRTQGVPEELLLSSFVVDVHDKGPALEFEPYPRKRTGLLFFCGAGPDAEAYAPLLRPLAEDHGYTVVIVRLPMRFAFLESLRQEAIDRARTKFSEHPNIDRWVVSGHSMGGAIACRFVQQAPEKIAGLVLVATTHPTRDDLSDLTIPVVKVVGTKDGLAPLSKVEAGKKLLPALTRYVVIEGANHSQFGHYGSHLMDGRATISREKQQSKTRAALLEALNDVNEAGDSQQVPVRSRT